MNTTQKTLEQEKLELDMELIDRELSAKSLSSFTTYTMPEYEMTATQAGKPIHAQIIEKLEAVEAGEITRLMIFCPPRLGKSELVSKRFPARFLGRNPSKSVVVASYAADLASDFGRKTKQIVEGNEYKKVFPEFLLSKDKREGGNWETNKGGGMYTVGRGGALTGKGGDILIVDDIVKDREEAESETIQLKTIDWYTSTFRTRKQKETTAIIVMMTRWNVNDLAGYLLSEQKEGGEKWDVLVIPGIDADGNEIIWPGKWSKGYMKNEQMNMSPKDFAALIQQDPIAASSNIFSLADCRYFKMSDFELAGGLLKKDDLDCIIAVDPAFSSSDSSDDASVILIGKHRITGDYYQLDGYAETGAPSKTFNAMLAMYDKGIHEGFRILFISIERVDLNKDQKKFIKDFRTYLKERDRYIQINEHKPKGKKKDRIKFTLEPKLSVHAIHFRSDMSDKTFVKRIETQLYQFPNCKKIDIIDDLEHGITVLDTRGKKKEKPQQKRYHNKITGKMIRVKVRHNDKSERFGL